MPSIIGFWLINFGFRSGCVVVEIFRILSYTSRQRTNEAEKDYMLVKKVHGVVVCSGWKQVVFLFQLNLIKGLPKQVFLITKRTLPVFVCFVSILHYLSPVYKQKNI